MRRNRVTATIDANGVYVVHVHDEIPFTYTVNNGAGLPELLLIGFNLRSAAAAVGGVAAKMRERGSPFPDGSLVDFGDAHPACLVDVTDVEEARAHMIGAVDYWRGSPFGIVQIILPDAEGRFPWDPGCSAPHDSMPVLKPHREANYG